MDKRATIKSKNPIYDEILSFFDVIATYKKEYIKALESTVKPLTIRADLSAAKIKEGFPIIDKRSLDVNSTLMKSYFLNLLTIVAKRTPKEAAAIKAQVNQEGVFESLIESVLQDKEHHGKHEQILNFLLQETINPLLAVHANNLIDSVKLTDWAYGYCPICGDKPIMAVIKGDEGKKILICSACNTQWPFLRMGCCHCETQEQKKVSYFIVGEDHRYRVEVCDMCKTYLKVIDQRHVDNEISFDTENLKTMHLDIIAQKKGYTNTNLFMMNSQSGNFTS